VRLDDKDLDTLFQRVESAWQAFGEKDAHWSVMSMEKFRKQSIEESLEEFYKSGEFDATVIDRTLARNGLSLDGIRTCTEIGCGVGRITYWLSRKFDQIKAFDVSEEHLKFARDYHQQKNIQNVDFQKFSSLDQIKKLPRTDFLFSLIVLQHNPPPVMAFLLDGYLSRLNERGLALFQVPTYLDDYSFNLEEYLETSNDPDILEMHVLPQKIIFEIAAKQSCRIIEVTEDGCIGRPPGGISNTFLLQKI